MPLILVTGLPSSGKSSTSQKILTFLKNKLKNEGDNRQVIIVSDTDILDYDGRDSVYSSIPKEKELRGWLRTEVQRYINLNYIVILDAAAYIKGFRYELFCISKEAKSQHCVVERFIDPNICWTWNEKSRQPQAELSDVGDVEQDPLEPDPRYSRETFDALITRYESCDENNRWDSPLFRQKAKNDELDFEELYNAITKASPLQPNKCTSLTSTTTSIYKHNK